MLQTGCKDVGSDIDRKWSGMSMNYSWLLVEPFRLPKGLRLYGLKPFESLDLTTQ